MCQPLAVKVNPSALYIPGGSSIAEGGFCTIVGTGLLLGAPQLTGELWAETFQTTICRKNCTPGPRVWAARLHSKFVAHP